MSVLNNFLYAKSAELDEKAVQMVVLVLGALGGLSLVAAKITELFQSAASGL